MSALWTKYKRLIILIAIVIALCLFIFGQCRRSDLYQREAELNAAKLTTANETIKEVDSRRVALLNALSDRDAIIEVKENEIVKVLAENDKLKAAAANRPKPVDPGAFKLLLDCQKGYKELVTTLQLKSDYAQGLEVEQGLNRGLIVDLKASSAIKDRMLADDALKEEALGKSVRVLNQSLVSLDKSWKRRSLGNKLLWFSVGAVAGGIAYKLIIK